MTALILVIAMIGIMEMTNLWHKIGIKVWLPSVYATGALYVLSAYLMKGAANASLFGQESAGLGAVMFFSVVITIFYLVKKYPAFNMGDLAATIVTPIYAGWLLAQLLVLRQLPEGFHFVVLVVIATWSTDTFAYFVGMNFGKRKLAPVLSPKKSIEGSIGGLAGSVLTSILVGVFYPQMSIYHYAIIGILVGTIGQIGDLAESALKRLAGVKDSGKLIPGHGGVLDRVDSLLLTGPVVYYYLRFFVIG